MTPAEAMTAALDAAKEEGFMLGLEGMEPSLDAAPKVLAALAATGFIVVPVVATAEMFEAMVERDLAGRSMKFRFHTFANQWRRMIELVPGVEPGSEEQLRQILAARPR